MDVDPIRYEMFLHRLWAVGEEGRSTLQRVTASPIAAHDGEVMSSFFDRWQIANNRAPVITPAVVRGRQARVHRLPVRNSGNSDLASLPRR